MQFTKATRQQRTLNACLFGPSGSGKTYTGLQLLRQLIGDKGRIACIDTERGSASLYPQFDFDTVSLTDYSVDGYYDALKSAEGYDALLIDSGTHAWNGTGGILERVDEIKRVKGYANPMMAWNDVQPEENKLWDAILDWPGHMVMTMRAKQTYEINRDERGKVSIEKLGMGAVQRESKEYEFDVVGRMDMDNVIIIEKSRCEEISGKTFAPGSDLAGILRDWLGTGAPSRTSLMAAVKAKREALGMCIDTAQQITIDKCGAEIQSLPDDQLASMPKLMQEFSEQPEPAQDAAPSPEGGKNE